MNNVIEKKIKKLEEFGIDVVQILDNELNKKPPIPQNIADDLLSQRNSILKNLSREYSVIVDGYELSVCMDSFEYTVTRRIKKDPLVDFIIQEDPYLINHFLDRTKKGFRKKVQKAIYKLPAHKEFIKDKATFNSFVKETHKLFDFNLNGYLIT